MTARRAGAGFAVVLTLGLIALLVAGAAAKSTRAWSLGVPNVGPVATVRGGQQACESPIRVPAGFGSLRVWASSVGGDALLAATVSDAQSSRVLARGQTVVMPGASDYPVELSANVPAGGSIRFCLTNTSPSPVYLYGSGQTNPSVHLTTAGKPIALGISLVAVAPQPRSLESQLSTVFSRAALFRPGWVREWTFWVLLVLVAAGLGLAGFAVAAAARQDG
jgi:hypothetical protein